MKKSKLTIPAWLFFALYNSPPSQKWTEEKEAVAKCVQKNLKKHLIEHDLQNDIITEPNNFDDCNMYSGRGEQIYN